MTDPAAPARRYPAQFLDGWSLAEQQVLVEVTPQALRITDARGQARATWDAQGLRSDAMQEGGVLHVTHGSAEHETLVVRDPELEQLVLAMCSAVTALPGGKNRARFVAISLASLVALGAGLYFGMPIVAHVVAEHIPLEQERALGAQVETFLDFTRCDDDSAQAALSTLAKALARAPSERYEVRIMDSDMTNAFALPGGIVVMTTGLLHKADDETEVAGVLAHELEHVTQRHVLAGFIRDAILSAAWALTMGDYAGLMVIDPSTAYRVANLEFSRADEQAADAGAVLRLHGAGLTHKGLVRFFERIEKDSDSEDGPEWLSTHPSTEARIARLERQPDVAVPARVLDAEQMLALKRACLGSSGAGDGQWDDPDAGVRGSEDAVP